MQLKTWIGPHGPILHDNTTAYNTAVDPLDPNYDATLRLPGLRTEGTVRGHGTPEDDDDLVRLRDLGGLFRFVVSASSVDLTSVGETIIGTVPSGAFYVPQFIYLRLLTVTALSVVPEVSLGAGAANDNIISEFPLIGFDTVNDLWINQFTGVMPGLPATTQIKFNVGSAATATALTAKVVVGGIVDA